MVDKYLYQDIPDRLVIVMIERVISTGFILVFLAAILMASVQFFVPLSVKSDFDSLCRIALIKMESEGKLTEETKASLYCGLEGRGFKDIKINGPESSQYGEMIKLVVKASYQYYSLTKIFLGEVKSLNLEFNKSCISRKIVN